VSTHPPVTNEPGIANVRGTLAMVKSSSDPNSATSQFFVNAGDNRGTYPTGLDYLTGGYTVFGRVAGNGMAVADTINHLPRGTYNLFLDGSATATAFTNFPMNAASFPSPIDQTKVVKINAVTAIPTLAYSITGNSNPSVATATIVNGQLHLSGLSGGQCVITVTARDLDNLTGSQAVVVDISDTYASWASRYAFPAGQGAFWQNPDGDAWNNLQEYAFMGDPVVSARTNQVVYSGITGAVPSARYLTLTFPVRKSAAGLTYAVEGNDGLSAPWTEVWKSTAGFAGLQVVSALNQSDRTLVTIKDTVALGARQTRFLRIRLVED
jgi:cyclophilin family peptidyl-prolyl cis-trans isomerase